MRLRWTMPSLRQLDEVGAHIALENPVAAERVTAKIEATVDRLREFPKIGRRGRVEGTREIVALDTSYVVAYAVREDSVVILAVWHEAREWPRSFAVEGIGDEDA